MKVLNLYAGIGGNRKLWDNVEVTAVEIVPEIAKIYLDFFPDDEVIVTDAHQFLLDHYKEYDFIWSSPPCPSHSRVRRYLGVMNDYCDPIYPDMKLYEEIIFLNNYFDGFYCVENVNSYYTPLIRPQTVWRHFFWANFYIRDYKSDKIEVRNLENCGYGFLEEKLGFDLSKYSGIDKRKVLRNCVDPNIGKLILDCARGNTVIPLTSFSKSKRIDEK